MMESSDVKIDVGLEEKADEMKKDIEISLKEDPDAEVKEPLNPYKPTSTEEKVSSMFEVSRVLTRTRSFTEKLRSISQEKHPARNPLGYFLGVATLCCTGTAVSFGLCLCVGTLIMLEIIPIAAIVVGAAYWERDRYCTAENIPLLLVVGGVLKVFHLTLSTAAGRDKSNAEKYVGQIAKKAAAEKKRKEKDVEDAGGEIEEKGNEQEQVEISQPKSGCDGHGSWFRLTNALLTIADLVWFLTATVIVFGMYSSVEYVKHTGNVENFCHKGLYRFALLYVIFFYVLLGLIVAVPLVACCCGLCALMTSTVAGERQ